LLSRPNPNHFNSILRSLDTGAPFVFPETSELGLGDGGGDVADNFLCPPKDGHKPVAANRQNCHSMAYALLRFLEWLPEPMIPYAFYPDALTAENAAAAYSVYKSFSLLPVQWDLYTSVHGFRLSFLCLLWYVILLVCYSSSSFYLCPCLVFKVAAHVWFMCNVTLDSTGSTPTRSWAFVRFCECSPGRHRLVKLGKFGLISWVRRSTPFIMYHGDWEALIAMRVPWYRNF
jgi:hypothetical protein